MVNLFQKQKSMSVHSAIVLNVLSQNIGEDILGMTLTLATFRTLLSIIIFLLFSEVYHALMGPAIPTQDHLIFSASPSWQMLLIQKHSYTVCLLQITITKAV